eukprot:TCONS_00071063-protein
MGEVDKIIHPIHQTPIAKQDGGRTEYEKIQFLGTSTGILWFMATSTNSNNLMFYKFNQNCGKYELIRNQTFDYDASTDDCMVLWRDNSIMVLNKTTQPIQISCSSITKDFQTFQTEVIQLPKLYKGANSHLPVWSVSYDEKMLVVVEQVDFTLDYEHIGYILHLVKIGSSVNGKKVLNKDNIETRPISFSKLRRVGCGQHEAGKPFLDCHVINNGDEVLIVQSSHVQTYSGNQVLCNFIYYSIKDAKVITSLQRPCSAVYRYLVSKSDPRFASDLLFRVLPIQQLEIFQITPDLFGTGSKLMKLGDLGLPTWSKIMHIGVQNNLLVIIMHDICYVVQPRYQTSKKTDQVLFKLKLSDKSFQNDRYLPRFDIDIDYYHVFIFKVIPNRERSNSLDVFRIRECNSLYETCCQSNRCLFTFREIESLNLPRNVKNDLLEW